MTTNNQIDRVIVNPENVKFNQLSNSLSSDGKNKIHPTFHQTITELKIIGVRCSHIGCKRVVLQGANIGGLTLCWQHMREDIPKNIITNSNHDDNNNDNDDFNSFSSSSSYSFVPTFEYGINKHGVRKKYTKSIHNLAVVDIHQFETRSPHANDLNNSIIYGANTRISSIGRKHILIAWSNECKIQNKKRKYLDEQKEDNYNDDNAFHCSLEESPRLQDILDENKNIQALHEKNDVLTHCYMKIYHCKVDDNEKRNQCAAHILKQQQTSKFQRQFSWSHKVKNVNMSDVFAKDVGILKHQLQLNEQNSTPSLLDNLLIEYSIPILTDTIPKQGNSYISHFAMPTTSTSNMENYPSHSLIQLMLLNPDISDIVFEDPENPQHKTIINEIVNKQKSDTSIFKTPNVTLYFLSTNNDNQNQKVITYNDIQKYFASSSPPPPPMDVLCLAVVKKDIYHGEPITYNVFRNLNDNYYEDLDILIHYANYYNTLTSTFTSQSK